MADRMLVFDIDGTLFDTKPGIFSALEEVFDRFGIGEFDRSDGMKYIGPPIKESLQYFAGLSEDVAEIATRYYREIYVDKFISQSILFEGIIRTLTELQSEGYRLAIATMKTKKQVDKLIDIFPICQGFFEYIETAAENGKRSKAEMIDNIRRMSSCASIVMIGDTMGDKNAADLANASFLGVTYGYGFKPESDYDFISADSADEICDVIKRL